MADPVAYLDGEFVPEPEASVPLSDAGLTWGYNVYDVFRTVEGEPYLLEAHAERLVRSCRGARIDVDLDPGDLAGIARELVDRNYEEQDLMVTFNVSGGWEVYYDPGEDYDATVAISSRPIPFARNAWKFVEGARLVTAATRQVPPETLSPKVKHRSRMHMVLADMEAKDADPRADPLLLDTEGRVAEVKHANVFVVEDGVVRTPPVEHVLPGVSRDVTVDLARDRGIPVEVEHLQRYDVYTADEVFYTNTTHVVTPVTAVDGRPVGSGRPGPVTADLLDAHSERAGIDIPAQFLDHLPGEERPERLRLGGDRGVG